jgi:hypothetical protein
MAPAEICCAEFAGSGVPVGDEVDADVGYGDAVGLGVGSGAGGLGAGTTGVAPMVFATLVCGADDSCALRLADAVCTMAETKPAITAKAIKHTRLHWRHHSGAGAFPPIRLAASAFVRGVVCRPFPPQVARLYWYLKATVNTQISDTYRYVKITVCVGFNGNCLLRRPHPKTITASPSH